MSNPHSRVRSYSRIEGILKKAASGSSLISLNLIGQIRYGPVSCNLYMLEITEPHHSISRRWREKNEGDRPEKKKSVCISAGIHGDEPAGVEALLRFIKEVSQGSHILKTIDITLFPCNNPYGYETGRRTSKNGNDLNREFRKRSPDREVFFIKKALAGKYFDLSLELHEDVDSPGFYLYELKRGSEEPFGREIVDVISKKYPINLSGEIEGMKADNGIISPMGSEDEIKELMRRRKRWPQALYQFSMGTRHCITCETPARLKMTERVDMHLLALEYILNRL